MIQNNSDILFRIIITISPLDLPQCPNVDQFNYESMKTLLFERFDNFQAAPFTIQRLCELLTDPKKHYSRLDKFMRALEKNILGKHFIPAEIVVNSFLNITCIFQLWAQ